MKLSEERPRKRKEWPVTGRIRGMGGRHGTNKPAKNTEKTAVVRIGIVGIGFMGMIHYLAARKLQGAQVTALCSRDPEEAGRRLDGPSRATSARAAQRMDLSGVKTYDRLDDLLADPEHRPHRCLQPDAPASRNGDASPPGRQARAGRKGHRADDRRGRRHAGQAARQAGKLLMVAHVLPFFRRVRLRGRGDPQRPAWQAARRSFQARHLQARLVGRDRRRQQDRRPGHRSAHPRHAFHRPGLRRAAGRVLHRRRRTTTPSSI